MRVPTTPAHLFFLRKKIPASQKARVGTSTVSLARGANGEVKERVKGKTSRVQSTRIGSALVCVRRNVQHRELKLSKSTRFALVTVVMVAVPTGCVVSPPPLFSQNMQSHEKSPTSHRAQRVSPTVSLALGANRKGKGRVKGKASRVCVCVCVFSSHSFWTSSSLDVPAGVTQTGGKSHRISHPPSFCGACLNFSREKDSAFPFPRRP